MLVKADETKKGENVEGGGGLHDFNSTCGEKKKL